MVVLILVLVWVAALLPIALKKRSEWELSSSISQFRHRRRLLVRLFGPTPGTSASMSGTSRQATPPWAPEAIPDDPVAPSPSATTVDPRAARAAKARRLALQARRRRTLTALLCTLTASLILGAVPALRPLWDLTIVAALCSVAYLAALVWLRRAQELAAERERKVVELTARARQSAIAPIRPRPPFVIVEATS